MATQEVENNSLRNRTAAGNTEEKKRKDPIKDYQTLPDNVRPTKPKPKKKIVAWLLNIPDDVPDMMVYFMDRITNTVQYLIAPKARELMIAAITSLLSGDMSRKAGEPGKIQKVDYSSYGSRPVQASSQPITKKEYSLYEDLIFSTEDDVKQFKNLLEGLYSSQEGYITVAQFMNCAHQETYPDQWNFGWTSLNGFDYKWSSRGWVVSMPFPESLN